MHREGMVTFFKSPALVVSILLAILGAFLWQGYPEKPSWRLSGYPSSSCVA